MSDKETEITDDSIIENIAARSIKGSGWVFSLNIGQQLLSLVTLVVLARILFPSDFGLVGIATLTIAMLNVFTETGFGMALIQKREDIRSFLNSAWTLSLVRGVIIFIFLILIAPLVAFFFNAPAVTPILQVLAFTVVLQGLTNIGVIAFQKELEFDKQFIFQFTGSLAVFVSTISAAFILRSVWALVIGALVGSAVTLLMSYVLHPYRPRLDFDRSRIGELWGFGKWVFASTIIIYFLMNGDNLFVGRFFGVASLGFYQIAYTISNLPATQITHVVSNVAFPAYSKLQHDLKALRSAYLRGLQLTAALSIPLGVGIFVLAPEFVTVFLGQRWMPMVLPLQILCLFGVLRSILAASGPVFYSLGRPDIEAKVPALQLLVMILLIYPLAMKWDLAGVAATVCIAALIILVIIVHLVMNLLKMNISERKLWLVYTLYPLIAIAPVLVLKVLVIQFFSGPFFIFCLVLSSSIAIYLLNVFLLDRYAHYQIMPLVYSVVKALIRSKPKPP